MLAGPGALHQVLRPAVEPEPGAPGPDVRRPPQPEPGDDRGEVAGHPRDLLVAAPGAAPLQHRGAVDVHELVVDAHGRTGAPRLDRLVESPPDPLRQPGRRGLGEQVEEDLLACPVGVAVEAVHGPAAEEQVGERRRDSAPAADARLVVQQAGSCLTPHDQGPAAEEAGREGVGPVAVARAGVRERQVAAGQE